MGAEPAARVVVDIGNSRMKWGMLDAQGRWQRRTALELDRPDLWRATIADWALTPSTRWAIASVNPPREELLAREIFSQIDQPPLWYRSAREVFSYPSHPLPENAGVDRALMVLAARHRIGAGTSALLISCGTAITVERINAEGRWEGGVIAAGLGMVSRALCGQTALLPFVEPGGVPPLPWGDSTQTSLAAGIFWGTVGTIREILSRQVLEGDAPPRRVWTGGDAVKLAPQIDVLDACIMPDLVLTGLALAAFGCDPGAPTR